MVWFKSDSGSSQVTRPSQLSVPSGSGVGDLLWAVGFASHGPSSLTPSSICFFRGRWIEIGRPLLRRPPRAPSRTPASAPWQRKSWASSVLSLPRPRQRVRAFNAGQCTAPVCPLFTCSRRSSRLCAAEDSERTRGTPSRCSLPSWVLKLGAAIRCLPLHTTKS